MRATEHGEIWEARVDKLRPVAIVSRDDVRGRRLKATVAAVTTAIRDLQDVASSSTIAMVSTSRAR